MKLSRVYVCNECHITLPAKFDGHFFRVNVPSLMCDGTLEPYLSQTSLEGMIQERIEELELEHNEMDIVRFEELQSILNAIKE